RALAAFVWCSGSYVFFLFGDYGLVFRDYARPRTKKYLHKVKGAKLVIHSQFLLIFRKKAIKHPRPFV
ncbi:MAG: hypothetical protein LBC29_01985, partial [Propionibacteriaceae bacterium]|nr:hypothetical protein [Propionibacteriaceae bacterium]